VVAAEKLVSDIAIFVLKRDVKLQLTNCSREAISESRVGLLVELYCTAYCSKMRNLDRSTVKVPVCIVVLQCLSNAYSTLQVVTSVCF